jgi:hypothetical protein
MNPETQIVCPVQLSANGFWFLNSFLWMLQNINNETDPPIIVTSISLPNTFFGERNFRLISTKISVLPK